MYFILLYFTIGNLFFSNEIKKKKGVDPDGKMVGEEMGEIEVGKILIRIYYVRKEFFDKREKIK